MLIHNLNAIPSTEIGIGAQRIPALHNTILNMRIVADIYIIQDDRILDHAVFAHKYLLE